MNGVLTADSTGCVTITFSDCGRVEAIRLSSRWREKLGSSRLAAALVEAVLLARAEQAADSPAPLLDPGPPAESSREVADVCRQALTEAAHQFDRDRRARRSGYSGSDARHHVTATLTLDGTPTAIDLDPQWLESVSTERLVDTIQEALGAAYDSVEAARREVTGAGSPAAQQLRRLIRSEGDVR